MDVSFFLRGLLIGFSIAAPVGPIGVLCIRRTLAYGRAVGFASGLGAATADMSYGAVAAFGLTAIAGALVDHQLWIRLIGGLFLGYLGIRTLLTPPAPIEGATTATNGLLGSYASTVALTLTNPATIFSFIAIFSGLGLVSAAKTPANSVITVAGVFLGSALWWLLLSGGVALLRSRVTPRLMRGVNILSGSILIGFAVVALVSLGAMSR